MKLVALLSFLLLFMPSIPQSSENSLYRISILLFDQVKELDQVELAINNGIQSKQYKSTDELFFMSTVMHITRSANAVIIGQTELLGVDPCVTQYKVWYLSTVNQSINRKKSILYAMMLQMSELSKHISTKQILKLIDLSIKNINASIKLLDKALILSEKNISDWAKGK